MFEVSLSSSDASDSEINDLGANEPRHIYTQASSLVTVKLFYKLKTVRASLVNEAEGTGLDRSCVPLLTKRSKEHLSSATVLRRASRTESCLSASDTDGLHTQSTGMLMKLLASVDVFAVLLCRVST